MGVVDDVTTYLTAQGLVEGVTGWDLVRRRFMDTPKKNQLVIVQEDGGPAPEIAQAIGIGDAAMKDAGVLVTVRGNPWDSDASHTKAQQIWAALHGLTGVALNSDPTYLRIAALTPEPIWVGYDDQNRPMHTIAFRLLAEV